MENISGGAGPYQLKVINESYNLSAFPQTIPLIAIGEYDVSIKDNNGCETTTPISIKEPEELTVSFGEASISAMRVIL